MRTSCYAFSFVKSLKLVEYDLYEQKKDWACLDLVDGKLFEIVICSDKTDGIGSYISTSCLDPKRH